MHEGEREGEEHAERELGDVGDDAVEQVRTEEAAVEPERVETGVRPAAPSDGEERAQQRAGGEDKRAAVGGTGGEWQGALGDDDDEAGRLGEVVHGEGQQRAPPDLCGVAHEKALEHEARREELVQGWRLSLREGAFGEDDAEEDRERQERRVQPHLERRLGLEHRLERRVLDLQLRRRALQLHFRHQHRLERRLSDLQLRGRALQLHFRRRHCRAFGRGRELGREQRAETLAPRAVDHEPTIATFAREAATVLRGELLLDGGQKQQQPREGRVG
mmetsp:Transcript_18476/g.39767  ORF Transcript_18476/g.39767 Transcript_18476/m.39767 type:complete len:275 (-) Transcript_18476:346-1170(-)